MSSTRLDQFAAAALTGLLSRQDWPDDAALAETAYRIAQAMMAERLKQEELPDSAGLTVDPEHASIDALELSMRIRKKLAGIGAATVAQLAATSESAIRDTGLGDESLQEIKQALHRVGLKLSQ